MEMPWSSVLRGVLVVAFLVAMAAEGTPICEREDEYLQDLEDCSRFYQCLHFRPVQKLCPGGLVFSKRVNVCVWPNSEWDDCTGRQDQITVQPTPQASTTPAPAATTPAPAATTPATATTTTTVASAPTPVPFQGEEDEPCRDRAGLWVDPSLCHSFFNCSLRRSQPAPFLGHWRQECPYSQLFDDVTKQCRPANEVNCNGRSLLKNPCDWTEFQCGGPHCQECVSRAVDCTDLIDGFQSFPGREGSPYYILCVDGWFIEQDQCPSSEDGRFRIFSPVLQACVFMT